MSAFHTESGVVLLNNYSLNFGWFRRESRRKFIPENPPKAIEKRRKIPQKGAFSPFLFHRAGNGRYPPGKRRAAALPAKALWAASRGRALRPWGGCCGRLPGFAFFSLISCIIINKHPLHPAICAEILRRLFILPIYRAVWHRAPFSLRPVRKSGNESGSGGNLCITINSEK